MPYKKRRDLRKPKTRARDLGPDEYQAISARLFLGAVFIVPEAPDPEDVRISQTQEYKDFFIEEGRERKRQTNRIMKIQNPDWYEKKARKREKNRLMRKQEHMNQANK